MKRMLPGGALQDVGSQNPIIALDLLQKMRSHIFSWKQILSIAIALLQKMRYNMFLYKQILSQIRKIHQILQILQIISIL